MGVRAWCFCVAAVAALAAGLEADDPWRRHNILVDRDVPARMRDGVSLFADIYRPDAPGPFPALLTRTPYNKAESASAFVMAAVKRGYVVAVQDVRGQFRSEGVFNPYLQEVDDGYDSIEWLAALPAVNGKVGTFGLSYPGAVQWMTATTRPPHLVAMVPAMTFANARHFIHHGGIFVSPIVNWLMQRQVKRRQELGLPLASPEAIRQALAQHREEWLLHLPLRDLPVMEAFPVWRDWIDHADDGPYWAPYDIEAQHERVQVPALNFTAWNDDDYGQPGAIRNFMGMRARGGSDAARHGQRLVIGPWTHGVPTLDRTTYAGVDFGPNAAFDYTELLLRFFDYWLKGVDEGYSQEPPVKYFVMGENVWREGRDWPPPEAKATDLFLAADGNLQWSAAAEARVSFTYDPRNPLRLPGDGLVYTSGPRSADWRMVTARRDVALFTSAPLARDLEITGQVVGHFWFSSSAPDTDVSVRLLDVGENGELRNFMVAPGVLRTRYRSTEDESTPAPLPRNQPVELTINVGYTSYVVRAGHRLQVYVGGSVFPGIHPNTWEPFTSWGQAVPATQTIHVGSHPSRLVLPVVPR